MQAEDLPLLEHQKMALREAGQALEAARPGAARDFRDALVYQPDMRRAIAEPSSPGWTRQLVAGLDQEAKLRGDPELNAERLVKTWNALETRHDQLKGWEHPRERSSPDGDETP